jgi:hypothetical protein
VILQYRSGNYPFVDTRAGQRSLFIAMANQMTHTPVPYRPWAVWLLRLLLIPIAGATGAMVFGLYTVLSTGRPADRPTGFTGTKLRAREQYDRLRR